MMAVDPTDDCTFWYTQEYYSATSDSNWRTRVGSFKFPGCGTPIVTGINPTNGPTAGGTAVTITGDHFKTAPGGTTVKFGNNSASNVSCSTTSSCTATSPPGNAGIVDVTVTTSLGTSPTTPPDQFTYLNAVCRSATLSAAPGSPQTLGTTITFTATASGCTTPQYRFWLRSPSGAWALAQDYGSSTTFNWNTTGLAVGTYVVEVEVHSTSGTPAEASAGLLYTLSAAPCSSAALSALPSSPQAIGTSVTFTATTSGCSIPQYRFWLRSPSGAWALVQDYGSSSTFQWNTTGLAVGTYVVEAEVHSTSGTPAEASAGLLYTLSAAPCSSAALSALPSSPQPIGTSVTFTASAGGCRAPQYRFWLRSPSGVWALVQDYGSSSTF